MGICISADAESWAFSRPLYKSFLATAAGKPASNRPVPKPQETVNETIPVNFRFHTTVFYIKIGR
jgi:hypothetical protein